MITTHSLDASDADVADIAAKISVAADHKKHVGTVVFSAVIDAFQDALLGHRLRLMIGSRTIMTIQLPDLPTSAPLLLGPTKLPMDLLRRMRDFSVCVRLDAPGSTPHHVANVSGEFLEAVSLATPGAFFEKVQLHGSRYKDPDLLTIGARAAFGRFDQFEPRASALTIQAHRILDKDFTKLVDEDWQVIDELIELAGPVIAEGQKLIEASPKPSWEFVRWTVSLATVAGNLAIMRDDLRNAASFFGTAAANVRLVTISHVSALNVINGCFFSGVLEAMLGNRQKAADVLREGIIRFKDAVAPQDLLANVWVIGDLINVAMASRQCYIARVRLGLWEGNADAKVDPGSVPILVGLKSPVARIVEAGLAPTFAKAFAKIGRVSG